MPVLSDPPAMAIPKLKRYIHQTVTNWMNPVESFKIGRTAKPNTRIDAYPDYDAFEVIYGRRSTNDVMIVEDALIKAFWNYKGCGNRAPTSQGGTAEDSQGGYVYLVIRRRKLPKFGFG